MTDSSPGSTCLFAYKQTEAAVTIFDEVTENPSAASSNSISIRHWASTAQCMGRDVQVWVGGCWGQDQAACLVNQVDCLARAVLDRLEQSYSIVRPSTQQRHEENYPLLQATVLSLAQLSLPSNNRTGNQLFRLHLHVAMLLRVRFAGACGSIAGVTVSELSRRNSARAARRAFGYNAHWHTGLRSVHTLSGKKRSLT